MSLWVNAELTRNSPQVIASNYMGERAVLVTNLPVHRDGPAVLRVGKRQLAGITVYATLPAGWHLVTGTMTVSCFDLRRWRFWSRPARPFSDSVPNTRGWNFETFAGNQLVSPDARRRRPQWCLHRSARSGVRPMTANEGGEFISGRW